MPELALPFPEDRILDTTCYGNHGIPHELFSWLRANDPVRKFHVADYVPFWAVTKNEHIREIEKQAGTFRSYPQPTLAPKTLSREAIHSCTGRRAPACHGD